MDILNEQKERKKKKGKVLLTSFLVFLFSFLSIFFLYLIPFFRTAYYMPDIFLVLTFVFCAVASTALLYLNHRDRDRHRDWRSYTILLSLFVYVFFFCAQALSGSVSFLKDSVVFEIVPYWGFFFGTLVFFLVLNLSDKIIKFVYTHFLLVSGFLFTLCTVFLLLLYTSSFCSRVFSEGVFAAIIGAEVFFVFLILSFVKGLKTYNKNYNTYFIIGISILSSFAPSILFVENWSLAWWFRVLVVMCGFSFLIAGFFKKEKKVEKIEEVFPKVVLYSRIGTRLIVCVVAVFILTLGVSAYFFSELKKQQIEQIIFNRGTRVSFMVDYIENRFKTYFENIDSICHLDEIDRLVQARDSAESEEVINMKIKNVSLALGGYVNVKPHYKRIYYVDEEGWRIVMVEKGGKGPELLDLVNVYDQEYFQGSINKSEGELYVSDITIDSESSEGSLDPIVYITSTVFNSNKEFRGMIVLEVDATNFMNVVRYQETTKEEGLFSIIDQEGRFVVELDNPEYEYWRNSSDSHRISLLYEHFKDYSFSGDITYREEQTEQEEGGLKEKGARKIVTHARVLYLPNNEERYFVIIEQIPENIVLAEVQKSFVQNVLALSFVFGISFFFIYLIIIRSIVSRVSNNVAVFRRLELGDFSVRTKIEGSDEITEVSKGINSLAEELEIRQKRQEMQKSELVERAKKAEEVSASLEKTKVAVMNILEDLDDEKKRVEEKVEERTKELREEKGKLSHVTQHMRTGVVFLNTGGEVLVVNKTMRDILNFGGKDDQDVLKVLQDKFKDINFKKSLAVCNTGKKSDIREVEMGGSIYSVAVRCEEENDVNGKTKDNLDGVFVWVEDVTEDRLIERSKSELVATASHQLRTPLTVARGNVEMLLDEDFGPLNDKQKEMLKDTSDSVIRLITMVNDMLDITKIEKGDLKLVIEEFDIEESISPIMERLKDYASRHDFDILYNKPKKKVIVSADKEHLQQVFQNLIDNAIRYSRQPGKVEITFLRKEEEVEVVIKDNGIGIPKIEQPNIFGRFFRAANAVRFASGGSGLGLFIVKSFVEQMQGKIWFESKENEGTTFHVTLPLKK